MRDGTQGEALLTEQEREWARRKAEKQANESIDLEQKPVDQPEVRKDRGQVIDAIREYKQHLAILQYELAMLETARDLLNSTEVDWDYLRVAKENLVKMEQ